MFRLAIDPNNDCLHVYAARNGNHYVFNSQGEMLSREAIPLEMSDHARFAGITDSNGNCYTIRSRWLLPQVVRTDTEGRESVVVRDPFYLWIVRAPLPAWLLALVGGVSVSVIRRAEQRWQRSIMNGVTE